MKKRKVTIWWRKKNTQKEELQEKARFLFPIINSSHLQFSLNNKYSKDSQWQRDHRQNLYTLETMNKWWEELFPKDHMDMTPISICKEGHFSSNSRCSNLILASHTCLHSSSSSSILKWWCMDLDSLHHTPINLINISKVHLSTHNSSIKWDNNFHPLSTSNLTCSPTSKWLYLKWVKGEEAFLIHQGSISNNLSLDWATIVHRVLYQAFLRWVPLIRIRPLTPVLLRSIVEAALEGLLTLAKVF